MASSGSTLNSSGTTKAPPLKHHNELPAATPEPTAAGVKQLWKFRLRPDNDDEPQDWWFASTAIPLLAATTGPLANVMSIAALITYWRNNYNPDYPGVDQYSSGFPDPHWCIALNAASLVCGFVGNIFLLFNFTRRVRYIVALPATIILWYCATTIVSILNVSFLLLLCPGLRHGRFSQPSRTMLASFSLSGNTSIHERTSS